MEESNLSHLNQVAEYYSKKIDQHGTTPLGVGWNGITGQNLRFEQLSKIIDSSCGFSITVGVLHHDLDLNYYSS